MYPNEYNWYKISFADTKLFFFICNNKKKSKEQNSVIFFVMRMTHKYDDLNYAYI